MLNKMMQEEYLKNEKIQIFIRLAFIAISNVSIYYYYFYVDNKNIETHSFASLMVAPTFVFTFNLIYLVVVKYFPYVLQQQRLAVALIIDITFSTYVMYLVDALAAYYAGAFLWFSIGYGMRYGKKVAHLAYVITIMSWSTLIVTSQFWIEHFAFGIGWLVTFIVLPLYYFKLVDKLHENIEILHLYAEKYEHRASHDQLTGLANRILFDKELQDYINNFKIRSEKFALFFIDLDKFKVINDTLGHDIGDKVLIEASRRLKSVIYHTYRLGGDEFVCICTYKNRKELNGKVQDLMMSLTLPCPNHKVDLSGSIGVACFPADAKNAFDIKKRADIAMYAAKNSGKNRYYFYEEIL
jgi:diguanylate cyclase (GGDEF)-like protein